MPLKRPRLPTDWLTSRVFDSLIRDVPTDLQVESRVAECLNARAVEEHVPAMKFLRRGDQRESRVSQLSRAALRVRDKERRHCVIRREIYSRSYVAIELADPSGCGCSAGTECCRKPSPRLPAHVLPQLRLVGSCSPLCGLRKVLAHVSIAALHEQLLRQAIRTGEIDRHVRFRLFALASRFTPENWPTATSA